jgi:hypothetical protein
MSGFRISEVWAIGFALLAGCWAARGGSAIEFTHVPAYGSPEALSGRVTEAVPAVQRVAVFIYVPSAGWYSKPFCGAPLTKINADGTWFADITTGGSDPFATEITALLVTRDYNEPCVLGLAALPTSITSQALASVSVVRHDPSVRLLQFSGYDWWVKSGGTGLLGPGPNYVTDSTNNVWVDDLGQLHLKITSNANRWECAEIVSDRSFGYGSYRFELVSDVDVLDTRAVLGLFTWSDSTAYAHREIDIECSRWANAADANNAQFVVQPFDSPGHLVRYRVPPVAGTTTHAFTWETNRVTFLAQKGAYSPAPPQTNVIRSWVYTLEVPPAGDEKVRLNLWLYQGQAPATGREIEFVVRNFRFVPPGTAQPPTAQPAILTNSLIEAKQFQFEVRGNVDWTYAVQSSTNLHDWITVTTFLATNSVMPFTDSTAIEAGSGVFYRCVTLP